MWRHEADESSVSSGTLAFAAGAHEECVATRGDDVLDPDGDACGSP
jgi:hypothetical protein